MDDYSIYTKRNSLPVNIFRVRHTFRGTIEISGYPDTYHGWEWEAVFQRYLGTGSFSTLNMFIHPPDLMERLDDHPYLLHNAFGMAAATPFFRQMIIVVNEEGFIATNVSPIIVL